MTTVTLFGTPVTVSDSLAETLVPPEVSPASLPVSASLDTVSHARIDGGSREASHNGNRTRNYFGKTEKTVKLFAFNDYDHYVNPLHRSRKEFDRAVVRADEHHAAAKKERSEYISAENAHVDALLFGNLSGELNANDDVQRTFDALKPIAMACARKYVNRMIDSQHLATPYGSEDTTEDICQWILLVGAALTVRYGNVIPASLESPRGTDENTRTVIGSLCRQAFRIWRRSIGLGHEKQEAEDSMLENVWQSETRQNAYTDAIDGRINLDNPIFMDDSVFDGGIGETFTQIAKIVKLTSIERKFLYFRFHERMTIGDIAAVLSKTYKSIEHLSNRLMGKIHAELRNQTAFLSLSWMDQEKFKRKFPSAYNRVMQRLMR